LRSCRRGALACRRLAFASATHAAVLLPLGADSVGNVVTGNSTFRTGDSRAVPLSETRSRFFAAEDFYFRIDARIGCGLGTATARFSPWLPAAAAC
jgi:hypothetical protein